jgi:hypothetical protein
LDRDIRYKSLAAKPAFMAFHTLPIHGSAL